MFSERKYNMCLQFWIFVELTNYKWQILFCVIFPLIDKPFTFQCTLHKNGTIWFAYKQVLIANEYDGRCDIIIKFYVGKLQILTRTWTILFIVNIFFFEINNWRYHLLRSTKWNASLIFTCGFPELAFQSWFPCAWF